MRLLVVAAALAASCPGARPTEATPAVAPVAAAARLTSASSAQLLLELELTRTALRAREVAEVRYELRTRRALFATGLQRLSVAVPPRTTTRLEVEVPVRTLEPLDWTARVPLRVSGQLRVRQGGDEEWLPFEGALELVVEGAAAP